MNVQPIDAIGPLPGADPPWTAAPKSGSFGDALSAAIGGTALALDRADNSAAGVAAGAGNIAEASIARAKADALLEIVSVTAAKVSAALNSLLQTQI